jgi:hypothetical protein
MSSRSNIARFGISGQQQGGHQRVSAFEILYGHPFFPGKREPRLARLMPRRLLVDEPELPVAIARALRRSEPIAGRKLCVDTHGAY